MLKEMIYDYKNDENNYFEICQELKKPLFKTITTYTKEQNIKEDVYMYLTTDVIFKALNAYDINKTCNPITYICNYCKCYIIRYLNKNTGKENEYVTEIQEYNLMTNEDDITTHEDLNNLLNNNLNETEVKVIKLYLNGYTFKQINNILNLKAAFYIYKIAIGKLKKIPNLKDLL